MRSVRDPSAILLYVTLGVMTTEMTLREWIEYGQERGFCSAPTCDTHEGLPLTEAEIEQFDGGDDPCVIGVRVYGADGTVNH